MDGALTFTHVCVDSSQTVLEHHRPFQKDPFIHICVDNSPTVLGYYRSFIPSACTHTSCAHTSCPNYEWLVPLITDQPIHVHLHPFHRHQSIICLQNFSCYAMANKYTHTHKYMQMHIHCVHTHTHTHTHHTYVHTQMHTHTHTHTHSSLKITNSLMISFHTGSTVACLLEVVKTSLAAPTFCHSVKNLKSELDSKWFLLTIPSRQ